MQYPALLKQSAFKIVLVTPPFGLVKVEVYCPGWHQCPIGLLDAMAAIGVFQAFLFPLAICNKQGICLYWTEDGKWVQTYFFLMIILLDRFRTDFCSVPLVCHWNWWSQLKYTLCTWNGDRSHSFGASFFGDLGTILLDTSLAESSFTGIQTTLGFGFGSLNLLRSPETAVTQKMTKAADPKSLQ